MIDFSQDYARLQGWFTKDLDLAVASRAISPQVKNSDEAKLVTRQGPIYTNCGWLQLTCLAEQHSRKDRSAVPVRNRTPLQ